jgi:N-acetyl-anhydromuramyl-L-alanine amidase AmpD
MNLPEYIIVHHTGGTAADPLADTSNHTFAIVNNYHRGLWNFRSKLGHYIGYHYFIDKTGKLTQGRADDEEGAHVRGFNRKSIGICLAGNFDATSPTKEQEQTLRLLLNRLSKRYDISKSAVIPHRKFANKTCYGRRLSDDWAAELMQKDQRSSLTEYTIMELINELKRRLREMRK